jgi:hypothetical protein
MLYGYEDNIKVLWNEMSYEDVEIFQGVTCGYFNEDLENSMETWRSYCRDFLCSHEDFNGKMNISLWYHLSRSTK